METKSMKVVRTHDLIVGLLYAVALGGVFMGYGSMIYMGFAVAALQILSPFTKFCPVYMLLGSKGEKA